MNGFSYKKLLLAFAVLGFVATAQAQEGGASNSVGLSLGNVFPLGETTVSGTDIKATPVWVPPAIGLSGEFAVVDAFAVEVGVNYLKSEFKTGDAVTASSNRFTLFVGGNYYIANASPVTPLISFDLGYSADMAKIGEAKGTILAPAGQVGLGIDYSLGTVNLGLQGNFVALGGAKHRSLDATDATKVVNTSTEGFMKKFVYGVGVALTVKMPL